MGGFVSNLHSRSHIDRMLYHAGLLQQLKQAFMAETFCLFDFFTTQIPHNSPNSVSVFSVFNQELTPK